MDSLSLILNLEDLYNYPERLYAIANFKGTFIFYVIPSVTKKSPKFETSSDGTIL